MLIGFEPQQLAFMLLVSIATGGLVLAIALPLSGPSRSQSRIKAITASRKVAETKKQSAVSRLIDGQKDDRRRKVQDTLKEIEARAVASRRGTSLRTLISRSGLSLSVRRFWVLSGIAGVVMAVTPVFFDFPLFIGALSGIVGFLGFPRWFLLLLSRRKQRVFLEGLADAVDVIIRGLKAGLPLPDALRVIAMESDPPIAAEFRELVEGQRLGVTIEQGFARMFERVPLPEVSFLAIVIGIQSKTGGNLSEALSNLSRVLRERRKMKGKVRAMAQEAKSSATIIGALPFFVIGALFVLNPEYLEPLLSTSTGHMVLLGSGMWMLLGILIMRKMINFDY